jgi:hypothetical protein
MNQCLICIFLSRQGFSAFVVHKQFIIIFSTNIIACCIVKKHLRKRCRLWARTKAQNRGRCCWPSDSDSAWGITILVNTRLDKTNLDSAIYDLSIIDGFYGYYCESSSLGASETERGVIDRENTNLKQTLENHMFDLTSPSAVFLDPWWIVILFLNKSRNYLIAGERTIPRRKKNV